MVCRPCAVKIQAGNLVFSSLLGWWGFPHGPPITPVQVVRNLIAIVAPPDPSHPSPKLVQVAQRPACLSAQGIDHTHNLPGVPDAVDDDFQRDDTLTEVPYALADILERELEPKERVVWRGQPDVVRFMIRRIAIFLFGIPFCAFAVFWTVSATSRPMARGAMGKSAFPWFVARLGGMFIAIGAFMLLSPLLSWWVARRTLYAVTDRRALLIEAPWRRRIQAFAGERLLNVVRVEDGYGRGDIILERLPISGSRGRTTVREIGFFGLEDVKHVEQLLRATVDRGRGTDGRLCGFLRND